MGLQEQLAEAIIIAFDELGGDPHDAVEAALRHPGVESWVQQETAKIAVAGGAEMAIPGSQILTIPAGISYLIHKMAHISWGIGALKGAYVLETPHYSDLRNILRLWANSSFFNARLVDHFAVDLDMFLYVLTDEGYNALQTKIAGIEDDNALTNTLYVLNALTEEFGDDERAQRLVRTLAGSRRAEAALNATHRQPHDDAHAIQRPLNRRISTRLAGKLAAQLSARVPARFVMGFIPFAGAIVNAFFNARTLQNMADTAEKYYDRRMTKSQFERIEQLSRL